MVGHTATPPVITPARDDVTGGARESPLVPTLSLGESLQQNSIVHLRGNVGFESAVNFAIKQQSVFSPPPGRLK